MGERYDAFRKFHLVNPHVFDKFEEFAREARKAGRTRFSAHMIGNRMRWYTQIETTGDEYKVNNNHLPYYAKLLMLLYPDEFGEFFQRRDRFYDTTDAILLEECG